MAKKKNEEWALETRTPAEILERCRKTIKVHRRRFIDNNIKACPMNCAKADLVGHEVAGCTGCGSSNVNNCKKHSAFVPVLSKQELIDQFGRELRNPGMLLRKYRDLVAYFWCIGIFDTSKNHVDEESLKLLEKSIAKEML